MIVQPSRTSHRRIRVLQFADLVNRHDFIDVIVRHADGSRFDVAVATLGIPSNIADPEYRAYGVQCWSLDAPKRADYPRAVISLASLIHRERFDIVHSHHYEPTLIAAAAVTLNPGARLVLGRHYSDAIYRNTVGAKRKAMLVAEAACNRRAARLVVPSTMIERLLRAQGVRSDKITVIPYGFEEEKFRVDHRDVETVRRELGLPGRFSIGTFARLYHDKGHRYLLKAMPSIVRAHPEVLLLLAGEGAERSALESQVDNLRLRDHVRFLGWRKDRLALMAAVDLVVQPTLQEAFSQAMIEPLWLGRPLVMTDVSGARDVLEDGVNAVVLPPADTAALRDALLRLAADADLRIRLGHAAKNVRKRLSVTSIVPFYEAVYGDVVSRMS